MNYQAAVEANNLGVACLEVGDLRYALERFSEALKYTMGDLDPAAIAQRVPPVAVSVAAAVKAAKEVSATSSCKSPSSGSVMRPQEPRTLPSSAPFAYARGINLIPCSTAYSPDVLINATIISSIVIFNLSIVYHLKGLEGPGLSIVRLNKAKSLYLKSHHLLVDAGVPLGSTGNPVIDMLSMALFNNLAHVSFEMSFYEDSRRFFDSLIRFALTVVPSRYGDAYVGSLLDQQKSSFLLNAIILQAPKLAAAA